MIDSALTEPGVFRLRFFRRLPLRGIFLRNVYRFDFYFFCIRESERQFVSVDSELHWISHRSKLHKLDFGSGHHSHIKEMLPQRALPSDDGDSAAFSCL